MTDHPPGSSVLIVCQHGEVLAHATVLELSNTPCECGGPLYSVRFNDGPAKGKVGAICGDALRRVN